MLAINWGYALLVTGMGIGTVFLLLIVLIGVIGLQSKIINAATNNTKTVAQTTTVGTTEMHPTPHEQAAIAMAMHLYLTPMTKNLTSLRSKKWKDGILRGVPKFTA